jgi:hypothetical protein
LGGSVVLAAVIVLGATSYIVMKTQKPAHSVMVKVTKGINRISMEDVKALTGEDSDKKIRKPEKPTPPPAFPARKVSGIVQVAYTVQPDGSVTDVHVTGAAPKGYYEKRPRHRSKTAITSRQWATMAGCMRAPRQKSSTLPCRRTTAVRRTPSRVRKPGADSAGATPVSASPD